jgi:hypothetical protein
MSDEQNQDAVTIDISFIRKFAQDIGMSHSEAMRFIGEQLLKHSQCDDLNPNNEKPLNSFSFYTAHCLGRWNTGDAHSWHSQERMSYIEALKDYNSHVANEPDATHSMKMSIMVDGM